MSREPSAFCRLSVMSKLLDTNHTAFKAVHADLLRKADAKRGRKGMTAEQVVRVAIVKQMLGLSYDELAFRLGDSLQLRGFCRLPPSDEPLAKSTLQANIGAIRAETWEAMNKSLVKDAGVRKVEGRPLDAHGHDGHRIEYPPSARFGAPF